MRPLTRWLAPVVIVGTMWTASAVGTAVTGVSDSATLCPSGTHLVWWEDGSGACYQNATRAVPTTSDDYERYPVVRDGKELSWGEDTFGPWDCHTMGNRICGPGAG